MIPIIIFIRQYVTSQVVFMNSLHYDYEGTSLGIIEACLHRLIPPLKDTFPHGRGFCLSDVVRIVNNNYVATFPGQRAIN